MSLASDLKNAVKQAMTAIGDVPVSITYTQVSVGGTYDPATDSTTNTETTHTAVPAVKCKVRQEEMDWTPVKANVAKFVIAYLDLPITPKLVDKITLDGATWEVKRLKPIPSDAAHVIFAEEV